MSWSKYEGRSAGRMLHCLDVYNQGSCNLNIDEVTIGNNELFYHRKKFAEIVSWSVVGERETPIFKFIQFDEVYYKHVPSALEKSQYIKRPFVDNSAVTGNLYYTIQEVKKVLTLEEACMIIWIRDKHNEDWPILSISSLNRIESKIKDVLSECYWGRAYEYGIWQHWKHIALCSVYRMTGDE